MSSRELLRETLKELLYGPSASYGLFSETGTGLLKTVHSFSYVQAIAPAAVGRPSPAQLTLHIHQQLDFVAEQLQDPFALLPDVDPWLYQPASAMTWREELVALAKSGQALNDALYLPLNTEQWQVAHAGIIHMAYHTGALRFHWLNLGAKS